MEGFDYEYLSKDEATGKLKAMLKLLNSENYRRFANDPQAGWDPNGIASISNLIIEEIINPDRRRFKYDNLRIVSLIHNPVITFIDKEDPKRLIYHRWNASNYRYFLEQEPEAFEILKKFAPVVEVNVQVDLLNEVLMTIAAKKLNVNNTNYAVKIIEFFFERSAEHLEKKIIINACQRCRYQSGLTDANSLLYLRVWHKLHFHFPTNNLSLLNNICTQQDLNHAADLCEQLYCHGSLRNYEILKHSSEQFIMAFFIVEKNLFFSGYEQKIEAVGNFLASLDIKNMGQLFENRTFMDQFFRTFKEIDWKGTPGAKKSIRHIVIKMCHYWRENGGDFLYDFLQDISRNVEKWELDSIEFTFQMNDAADENIANLKGHDFDAILNKLKSMQLAYDTTVIYYKYINPMSSEERYSLLKKLSYDQSPYDVPADQVFSMEAREKWFSFFEQNSDYYWLLDISQTVCKWNSFQNLLKDIKGTEIALIHEHGDDMNKNENNRGFFCDHNGTKFFTACLDFSLSLLLEILDVAKESKYFAGFKFQFEEVESGRRVRSQLDEKYLKSLKARFKSGIFKSFAKYGEEKDNEILEYITLLVDIFCIGMEVTKYDYVSFYLFDYFYVPVVKALLLFSPRQAIRLIVAFCQSDLKLNLKATYKNRSVLQNDWSRHQKEQSEEERMAYFETFNLTVPDLMKNKDHCDQSSNLEFLMLTDYVGAVVNYQKLYNAKEVIDYYVLHKYYLKINSHNITRHDWGRMSKEEAQKLLLSS
ncbi:unnamed protein product [Caenorhabditis brenneri]